MNKIQEEALNTIIRALEIAQSKGAFSMKDSAILLQSINVLHSALTTVPTEITPTGDVLS